MRKAKGIGIKGIKLLLFGSILGVILAVLLLATEARAATIQGKIYSPDLELAKKAIVNINSTPKQNLVANDGTYSFIVPQGTYEIEAFYTFQGTLLYDKETITVPQEGTFTLDLILFETPDIEDIEFDESELALIEDLLKEKPKTNWPLIIVICAIAVAIAIVLFYFISKRKLKKLKTMKARAKRKAKVRARAVKEKLEEFEEKPVGDEAMKRTLDILKREHRVTQKDLRKELGISEAKASLIIADLEAQGKVRKIKRGRGNIIIYQE